MAWICWDLDDTLLATAEEGQPLAVPGAVEVVNRYQAEGHRQTVFTSRFAPMPDSERDRMRQQIETELEGAGFPPLEIWVGTTRPMADFFVGKNEITFDDDFGLLQAQLDYMMHERGLSAPAQMAPQDGQEV